MEGALVSCLWDSREGISSSGCLLKNSGWKLDIWDELRLLLRMLELLCNRSILVGIFGGGSLGLGGLILKSVMESADLRGLGAGALDLAVFEDMSSILLRAVKDFAL